MTITNLLEDSLPFTNDVDLIKDIIHNPLYFQKLICEENGKIVGVSLARLTSEMTWVENPEASKLAHARAFKILLKEQTAAARRLGINQVHVWTDIDPNVMQHMGFIERKQPSYILHF